MQTKSFFTQTRWLVTIILTTFSIGHMWGTDYTWTLPWSTTAGAKESNESSSAKATLYNSSGTVNGGTYTTRTGVGSHISVPSSGYFIVQVPITSATTSFTLSADIYGWKSSKYAAKSVSVVYYSSKSASTTDVCSGSTTTSGCYSISQTKTLTSTYTEDNGTLYIKITPESGNIGFESLSVTVSAGSCSANVAIGTVSLNGSFNLTTVGVQCASITVGSNCAVAANNYGFIWYQGTGDKVIGGDGVTRVNNTTAYSSGSFSNTLSGSFTAGTTYTFRAFAINDKPSTAYSAAVSFTPYTVTFNMNGHGSAPSQQVVNTGGTASQPSAPSATGYTFGGWYQEAGCTNAVNWSSTITANKNYYAKWTAKEYTVTLDNESPTVSGSTSVTLTYNSASHAAITNPTKTGYTFAGWWTGDNGTGTEVINTSGVLQASVSNYTGAGGIWTRDNNSTTLYAKWTAKSFTVTWMVNGESYSAGGSTSVDFGSHVATLPTAPTPPCGNKFMGWTTTNIGSVGLDKDDDAAAITALNLFTTAGDAPVLTTESNVTYYAVFADYAE